MGREEIDARVRLWQIGMVVIGHARLCTATTTKESQNLFLLHPFGSSDAIEDGLGLLACVAQLRG